MRPLIPKEALGIAERNALTRSPPKVGKNFDAIALVWQLVARWDLRPSATIYNPNGLWISYKYSYGKVETQAILVPKHDIVLGFHTPYMRQVTQYAAD